MSSARNVLSLLCIAMFAIATQAQTPASPSSSSTQAQASAQTGDGKQMDGYQVQQSIEFGYRFTDITGSQAMYGTLINQNQGPRLLEQSLTMTSPMHSGLVFDNLSVSSFGWGGDPENVAQARMSKFHFYDLSFVFRRDQNYFDYDLLANPLNPPTSKPSLPVDSSPHSTYNTRRMYDFDLTILPQSKFTFRLGMSHNRSNGPTFSSVHVGTDALLHQDWSITDNLYRFGFDMKALSRTVISYDQFLDYGKNDTGYGLASFANFPLSNGQPVELGLPINSAASQPCASPVVNGIANATCNAFYAYTANQRLRTTSPTEQLRLVSNWHRVSLTAQGTYSNTDMTAPYQDFFNGLSSRSGQRQATTNGMATARRVNATADLGLTVQVSKSIRISDSFRYENWHIPGESAFLATSTVGIPVGTPPAVTLLSPLGATTTSTSLTATLLGMRTFYNLFQVEYNPDRFVGVRAGYKLRHRNVFHGEPESLEEESDLEPFEGDNITLNEQGPVLGVWFRPTQKLRINLDAEAMTNIGCQACSNADEIFISRISPKQRQNYRARANYKPSHWTELSASVNWWESRNGASDTQYTQHYRNAGFVLSLFPSERMNLNLNYNYTDALQDAYICYNGSFIAPGAVVNACPTYNPANTSANNNPNWIYSNYSNTIHYFNALLVLRPVKRLTANVGYGLTHTDGNATILNTLQPLGPAQFSYQQPLGSLSYEVVKNWSLNAYWNYDQYSEGSFVGPTFPRYFHDNRTVLSVRYAF